MAGQSPAHLPEAETKEVAGGKQREQYKDEYSMSMEKDIDNAGIPSNPGTAARGT